MKPLSKVETSPVLYGPTEPQEGAPSASPPPQATGRDVAAGVPSCGSQCPGPNCMMCNGEGCNKCGAGFSRSDLFGQLCEHDVIERHEGVRGPQEGAPRDVAPFPIAEHAPSGAPSCASHPGSPVTDYAGCFVCLAELQEGAPSTRTAESASVGTGGAPSCDSAELAAIREWVEDPDVCHTPGELKRFRALLRMVDVLSREKAELTKDVTYAGGLLEDLHAIRSERDELRAKLVEADKKRDTYFAAWQVSENRAADRLYREQAVKRDAEQRAEAAEAKLARRPRDDH